ncbi:MAG: hypothetical protein JNJ88_06135 [Planctomycetes bacterium]|nr:hypothetical protein [Planctomycetota bacterium]
MIARAAACAIGAAALAGCSNIAVFRFEPSPRITGEAIVKEGVAIPPVRDSRGRDPLNHNLKNLALIPFIPFATSYADFPERAWFDASPNLNGFDPSEDLAEALRLEIEGQGLFRACRRVPTGVHGERYELKLELQDCHISEGYLTYGVSLISPLLHLLGFPEGTLRCRVGARATLVDRRTAAAVWTREIVDQNTQITWIYNSREADLACRAFSRMLTQQIRLAVAELREQLAREAVSGGR